MADQQALIDLLKTALSQPTSGQHQQLSVILQTTEQRFLQADGLTAQVCSLVEYQLFRALK
jgi:hypothetical protein